jgi:hypothetical protein
MAYLGLTEHNLAFRSSDARISLRSRSHCLAGALDRGSTDVRRRSARSDVRHRANVRRACRAMLLKHFYHLNRLACDFDPSS